jgi:hypothetical protein
VRESGGKSAERKESGKRRASLAAQIKAPFGSKQESDSKVPGPHVDRGRRASRGGARRLSTQAARLQIATGARGRGHRGAAGTGLASGPADSRPR